MAATLNSGLDNNFGQLPIGSEMGNGTGGMVDAIGQHTGIDGQFSNVEGGAFFDYGMSFGLSPVFRFDPALLNLDGSTPQMQQDFTDVDYRMRPQS